MATITIRDIPDDLFARVKTIARDDQCSVNAEVLAFIAQAVQHRDIRSQRLSALEELARIRTSQPPSNEADTLEILDVSAYDACYVALAEQRQVPLLTADVKLTQHLVGSPHQVFLVEDYLNALPD